MEGKAGVMMGIRWARSPEYNYLSVRNGMVRRRFTYCRVPNFEM
jgi:hypothetical protein